MDTAQERSLVERLERLEAAVTRLEQRVVVPTPRAAPGTQTGPASSEPQKPRRSRQIESRPAEWWLARGGAVLTLVALVLLYQYAIDHGWITPATRIAFGVTLGAGLMFGGTRLPRGGETVSEDTVGLREVLLGAGLAAWYVTAYAAALFYGMIATGSARVIFIGLSVAGAWLGLREKRALLALFALAVGFATPGILPTPVPSIPVFALYLASLAAVGLVLYLLRGWQSVLWLTFAAFWWSTGAAAEIACCSLPGSGRAARLSLSVLIMLATVAMVRVPILRRRLLALGSPIYTQSRRSEAGHSILAELARNVSALTGRAADLDSPAMWLITLSAPLLALAQLSITWPRVSPLLWALGGFGAAAIAFRFADSAADADDELTHLGFAAAALFALAGLLWLAMGLVRHLHIDATATSILAATVYVAAVLEIDESRYLVPLRIARMTAGGILVTILLREAVTGKLDPYWTTAALTALAITLRIAWAHRHSSRQYAAVLAASSYVALMLIDARVLGLISRPLVTASYAIAGTALLIAGRNATEGIWLRRAGALTLVVVVARLLVIDMDGVETIWRVLLFLGCGALFLFASYRLQRSGGDTAAASPRS